MKAAVLHALRQPLRIEEVPEPEIGPNEVLVETRTCSICRTDLHICDGVAYIPKLPHIPGHEPAGVVAKVGANVTEFKTGQRVVPYLFLTCGRCFYCRTGRDSMCPNLKGPLGVTINGGFAEQFVVHSQNLFVLPNNVSFEAGGTVSCAVITAVHAFHRSRVGLNETAVVLGAGGVAQPLIQILKAAGVRIVVVSRSQEKLDIGIQLGAHLAVKGGTPNAAQQIKDFAGGDGVQCVYDCVASASTMEDSASYVMRGGQIIVIGEEPEFPKIDTIKIAQRELEIIGSRNGSRQDCVESIAMLASGIVAPPISRVFPLEEINEALEFMRSGRAHARIIVSIRN